MAWRKFNTRATGRVRALTHCSQQIFCGQVIRTDIDSFECDYVRLVSAWRSRRRWRCMPNAVKSHVEQHVVLETFYAKLESPGAQSACVGILWMNFHICLAPEEKNQRTKFIAIESFFGFCVRTRECCNEIIFVKRKRMHFQRLSLSSPCIELYGEIIIIIIIVICEMPKLAKLVATIEYCAGAHKLRLSCLV